MRACAARVVELLAGDAAGWAARLACPASAIPSAGRYSLAWSLDDETAPLATPLFLSQAGEGGFIAAPPIPAHWEPGMQVALRGPLGNGFSMPSPTRRLALAALGETTARLHPLMRTILQEGGAVALFTDQAVNNLPAAVEINPLDTLAEALSWADFLALDLPVERLSALAGWLRLDGQPHVLPCPAQALVITPMPCAGLAECGACAVLARHRWKLTCQDGPVFPLLDLL